MVIDNEPQTRDMAVSDAFGRDFYVAFAKLVIEFGRLEYLIQLCVKDLHGRGFTEGMIEAASTQQFRRLCGRAKSLAAERLTANEYDQFASIIENALRLGETRNDSVHAFWSAEHGTPYRTRPKWVKATRTVDWTRGGTFSTQTLLSTGLEIRANFDQLDRTRMRWSVRERVLVPESSHP